MIKLYLVSTNQLFMQPGVLTFTISFLFFHFTQLKIIWNTDNIQMGFDILFRINELQKTYVSFFMDEFTPEWIFKSKNHNWFGWQFGYNIKDLILKNSELQIEYNWTDQRIYA